MSFRENLLDIEGFFLILIVEETYFIQEGLIVLLIRGWVWFLWLLVLKYN